MREIFLIFFFIANCRLLTSWRTVQTSTRERESARESEREREKKEREREKKERRERERESLVGVAEFSRSSRV